jgi:hypothetical protein
MPNPVRWLKKHLSSCEYGVAGYEPQPGISEPQNSLYSNECSNYDPNSRQPQLTLPAMSAAANTRSSPSSRRRNLSTC